MKRIRFSCFAIIGLLLAAAPVYVPDGRTLAETSPRAYAPAPAAEGATRCAVAPERPFGENNGGATHTKLPSGLCDGIADDC